MIKDFKLNHEYLHEILALGVFGSYHELCFDKDRGNIDIMILLKRELDFSEEFKIEDYLDEILPQYFNHNNIHYKNRITFFTDIFEYIRRENIS